MHSDRKEWVLKVYLEEQSLQIGYCRMSALPRTANNILHQNEIWFTTVVVVPYVCLSSYDMELSYEKGRVENNESALRGKPYVYHPYLNDFA